MDAGTLLGTMRKPGPAPCGQKVPINHVHVALLQPTDAKTAQYITFAGQSLCGHEVVPQSGTGAYGQGQNVLLDGLTWATPDKFTVPACWTT